LPQATPLEDDPWLAIQTNNAGALNYVRQSEIEAFADVSPTNCMLILSDGEEIRVFQKCAPVAPALKNERLVSFPNEFGMVFVSPPSIFDLFSTNTSGCRLNLKNRKLASVNQSCESVHQGLTARIGGRRRPGGAMRNPLEAAAASTR
jgi:hypothetical protein